MNRVLKGVTLAFVVIFAGGCGAAGTSVTSPTTGTQSSPPGCATGCGTASPFQMHEQDYAENPIAGMSVCVGTVKGGPDLRHCTVTDSNGNGTIDVSALGVGTFAVWQSHDPATIGWFKAPAFGSSDVQLPASSIDTITSRCNPNSYSQQTPDGTPCVTTGTQSSPPTSPPDTLAPNPGIPYQTPETPPVAPTAPR